jgi:K+-sensing histidine kinase KdpD
VAETVRQVWNDFAPLSGVAADSLVLEVDPALTAMAAPGSLFKILVHVLDNAAKYGEQPTTVRASASGGRVVLEVVSPGAPIADVTMLCEPFYRSERAVMRAGGLGVGLTVARALAEQAGGELSVEAPSTGGLITRIELDEGGAA